METKPERKRVNLYLSDKMYSFYEEQARDYGMTVTQTLVMALKFYIDGQKAMSATKEFTETLTRLKDQTDSNKLPLDDEN